MVTYNIMTYKFICLCSVMYSTSDYMYAHDLENKFRELLFTGE